MVGGMKNDTPTPFVSIYLLSDFRLPLLSLHNALSSYVPATRPGLALTTIALTYKWINVSLVIINMMLWPLYMSSVVKRSISPFPLPISFLSSLFRIPYPPSSKTATILASVETRTWKTSREDVSWTYHCTAFCNIHLPWAILCTHFILLLCDLYDITTQYGHAANSVGAYMYTVHIVNEHSEPHSATLWCSFRRNWLICWGIRSIHIWASICQSWFSVTCIKRNILLLSFVLV